MQNHFNNLTTPDISGRLRPVGGASVTVHVKSSGALAVIYSDNGETTQANPMTTDTLGYYEFYAADEEYTLTFSGGTINTFTRTILLEDPDDSPLSAGGGSSQVGFIQAGTGATARTVEGKLREAVSVMDFGAVGDGVTDDTAAFSLAAQAATAGNAQLLQRPDIPHGDWSTVHIPAGDYLLSSLVNTGNKEIVWAADIAAVITNPDNLNGRLARAGSKISDFHHGTEDASVSLSIMANRNTDEIASVSGFTNPNQLSYGNGRDTVAAYIGNRLPAALYGAATVTSYNAEGATLATPLTADQLKKMRKGMLVQTRHSPQMHAAYVDSWTANTITVADGWFLVDGSASGSPVTPTGTDGLDLNIFRKVFGLNVNAFIDTLSYGNQANAFELGLRNNRGEPTSRGGTVAETTGMVVAALDNGASYYCDKAYVAAGKWSYGYHAYGSVTNAFVYDGTVGPGGDPLESLLLGKSAAGKFFYNVKVDGTVEAGARGAVSTVAYDFHTGATDCDYDSRISANGGTGVIGGGNIEIYATQIELRATTNIDVHATTRPETDNSMNIGQPARRFAGAYAVNFRPGDSTPIWTSGAGSPNGVLTAVVGSMYTRTDGGASTTLYIKETGTGNTGWVAK